MPGYLSSLENVDGKKRYKEKLAIIGGLDPYETDWSKLLGMILVAKVNFGMITIIRDLFIFLKP